jgi:hypothetical protein
VSTTPEASRTRPDQQAGTTGAPAGQTPVAKATAARLGINMISAVNAEGALRFSVSEASTMPLCGSRADRPDPYRPIRPD